MVQYANVFNLKENMDIALGFPFDSRYMNKLAYAIKMTEDSSLLTKVLVMPYLHDRKLYNQQREENTKYFVTQLPEIN